jgi:acyl carrier protein
MERNEILRRLTPLIADLLGIDDGQVTINAIFADLGADSIAVREICLEVKDDFGISMSQDVVEKMTTVEELLNLIHAKFNPPPKIG